jgi:hypothetical protein
MAQVESENSIAAPVVSTRRRFLSQAAGAAAGGAVLAVATFPPAATAAAPVGSSALALDGTKISRELRDLVHTLQDADEALKATMSAHDAEYELFLEWLKRTPEPTDDNRRAWRRWNGRHKKFMRENSFYSTQEAYEDACRAHRDARKAIAEYRSRDMNELGHKACLVCVFEDGKRGYNGAVMAQGVALDVARMSTGRGFSA